MIGLIKVSRSIKDLSVKIKEIKEEYLKKTGKEITISQIAKKLDVSEEEIAIAIDSLKPLESIDKEAYEDGDESVESKIVKEEYNKDEANIVVDNLWLKELIGELEPREKQIIFLRYFKDKTQCEVAKILGISQVQVSRIEKRILISMRSKI